MNVNTPPKNNSKERDSNQISNSKSIVNRFSLNSQALSNNEEAFEYLRRKDDVMRQTFYFEFMSIFNQN